MGLSTARANAILDAEFADTVYLGASTAHPGSDGASAAEPVGNNYARVQVLAAGWGDAAARAIANAAKISFPAASGSWGTITHVCVYSASSGGTFRGYAPLDEEKAISSGDTLEMDTGELTFTLTDADAA